MQIETEQDFAKLNQQFSEWRKRFPMFAHDVKNIERAINNHIQNHSRIMVDYRRTHNKSLLETAKKEINSINQILDTAAKLELMALLNQR
jgi:light-regulated signal transduction histidine kinase (bacteriophytochrome)